MPEPKTTALRERMREDLRIRGYSPRTITAYLTHVRWFALHFRRSPLELTSEDVRSYLLYLKDTKQVGTSYFLQSVAALRFFYTQTAEREWMRDKIPYPKKPKRLPVALTQHEVAALLAGCDDKRVKTILAVIYGAGLRLMEVLALQPDDVNSTEMFIRVRCGKGARERRALLSPAVLELLRHYYKTYRPHGQWLFGSKTGKQLSHTFVQKACAEARVRARLQKRATPHSLRHSFAKQLLEQGVDINVIGCLLGHASPSSTRIYTHVSSNVLRNIPGTLDSLPT